MNGQIDFVLHVRQHLAHRRQQRLLHKQAGVARELRQQIAEPLGVGVQRRDVARAFGLRLVDDGRRLRAGLENDAVRLAVRIVERLVAVFARGGDARKDVRQLPRRDVLQLAVVNHDAELLLVGELADALLDGVLKAGHVACKARRPP